MSEPFIWGKSNEINENSKEFAIDKFAATSSEANHVEHNNQWRTNVEGRSDKPLAENF